MSRWSEESVLEALNSLRAQLDGMLYRDDVEKAGPAYPGRGTIERYLGSWAEVCRRLGQPYVRGASRACRHIAADGATIELMRRLERETGIVLTSPAYEKLRPRMAARYPLLPTRREIERRFGRWSRVRELMGDPPPDIALKRRPSRWTRGAILQALRKMQVELGASHLSADDLRPALRRSLAGGPFPSLEPVLRVFGSWEAVRRELAEKTAARPGEPEICGQIGVLAFDAVENRVQCHECGRWYRAVCSHIRVHSLDAGEYKELHGLNRQTALQVPELSESARRLAIEQQTVRNLIPFEKGKVPHKEHVPLRVQAALERRSPEEWSKRSLAGRRWSYDGVVQALYRARDELGRPLRHNDLEGETRIALGLPSKQIVDRRLGSWRKACELLGQEWQPGTYLLPNTPDEEILETLRRFEKHLGRPIKVVDLQHADTRIVPGVGAIPTDATVRRRFGSLKRTRQLMRETPAPRPRPAHKGR